MKTLYGWTFVMSGSAAYSRICRENKLAERRIRKLARKDLREWNKRRKLERTFRKALRHETR